MSGYIPLDMGQRLVRPNVWRNPAPFSHCCQRLAELLHVRSRNQKFRYRSADDCLASAAENAAHRWIDFRVLQRLVQESNAVGRFVEYGPEPFIALPPRLFRPPCAKARVDRSDEHWRFDWMGQVSIGT